MSIRVWCWIDAGTLNAVFVELCDGCKQCSARYVIVMRFAAGSEEETAGDARVECLSFVQHKGHFA